jgi:hypothetical protein
MRTRVTIAANDFTSDSDVVALYNLDNNLTDSINSQNLTPSGTPPSYTFDSRQGTYAGSFSAANTEYGYITDTGSALVDDFPGKGGTSPVSFSVCCWFKAKTATARSAMVAKYDFTGSKVSFALNFETSKKPRFAVGYNGGVTGTNMDFSTILDLNTWYHMACTYTTGAPYTMKIRVRHQDGTLVGGANTTGVAGGEFSPTTSPFEIGRHNITNANVFDGFIDEVVVFKRALSDADIDKIFNRTFS